MQGKWACYDFSLNRQVVLSVDLEGLLVTYNEVYLRIGNPSTLIREALEHLRSGFLTRYTLACIRRRATLADVLGVLVIIDRLDELGLLAYSCLIAGKPLLTAFPSPRSRLANLTHDRESQYILSSFTYFRRDHHNLCLTSPLLGFEILLFSHEVVLLLARLAAPVTVNQLTQQACFDGLPDCLSLLLSAGAISLCSFDGSPSEDQDESLRQWEFHDLIYHLRSREGFHSHRTGGTYRFRNQIRPQSAIQPVEVSDGVVLPEPSATSCFSDGHLFNVLERRRSIRKHGERSIKLSELSELLYRSARMTALYVTTEEEVCTKPFPSGGGIHELELYLFVSRCDGIEPGVYKYQSAKHWLEKLNVPLSNAERLLTDAALASLQTCHPDILIVIAARFQRISWKYESIAYSLVLKHVGCLMQTLYLVATALNLAPCAIGGGNSKIFSQVVGKNFLTDTSVGEFVLSSQSD